MEQADNGNPVKFKLQFAELSPTTPRPGDGRLSFQGNPTGISFNGGQSVFSSSVGFTSPSLGTVVANSSFNFGELSSPNVAGLLTTTFNELNAGLPPSLQSNLRLNLSGQQIDFHFPDGATSGFVSNFSLDIVTDGAAAITAVPEPTSFTLLSLGLGGLVYGLRRNRWRSASAIAEGCAR